MPGAVINGEKIRRSSSLSGSLSHFKRTLKQDSSPISPLSPESFSCGSLDLAIHDGVDNSIELLYKNVYDMESSEESHSTHSFTTYGNESKIDSELCHLVGVENTDSTLEDIKSIDVLDDKEITKKKVIPSKDEGKTKIAKSVSQRPPIGKRNMMRSSRRSFSGCLSFDERNSKDRSGTNQDLGRYLLKKARDIISSGDDPKRAFELILRAKKSYESCVFDKPNLDFVMCLHILASMYCTLGQHNEAIPLLERSIEIPSTDLGQNHALAKFVGCMQLGDIYAILGQIKNSILHYKAGLEIQKVALGENNPQLGETCRYVAEAHVQAFEFDEAEKLCQMALDIHKAANNSSPSIQEGADRRLMGLICDSKGNYKAALEHYVLASTAMHSNGYELDVATIDCNIGDAYLALARYDEAICSYKKALTTFKSSKGEKNPAIAMVFVRLAELHNKIGKFGESKSYCEKALKIYDNPSHHGDNKEDIANGLTDLAAIYESMNELDRALDLLHKALEMYNGPSQKSTIAGIEAQMGVIYYMLGNYEDSYNALKSSISKFQDFEGENSSLYGITLNQLGLTCVQLYKITEAAELFEEAKSVLEREYGCYHPDTLGVYSNLAGAYDALGRWDDAIELLEFVVGMREEKLGTADPVVDDEKRRLAELLKEAGRGRRRKSRSLETLLDKNSKPIIKRNFSCVI